MGVDEPTGQGVHGLVPFTPYWPGGQGRVQLEMSMAPIPLVPLLSGGQLVHAVDPDPLAYVEKGQRMHTDAPGGEYRPGRHTAQAVLPEIGE